jgi:3D (Asp-Asp-Asp) domain-containing protein
VIGAPTPTEGARLVPPPPSASSPPPLPDLDLSVGTLGEPIMGNGRPRKLPRRRLGKHATAMLALVVVAAAAASAARLRAGLAAIRPLRFAPVVVAPPLRMDGALVLGAARDWAVHRAGPLRYGYPVPVELTAYCLKGTTRRDNYVREGIVASDPKMFPLGRYLEIYVGRQYYGRFLIDDTGGVIKGNKLDIWTPTCREARIFGRVTGTAVLVPKPRGAAPDTVTTGRLGGKKA